MPRFSHRQAFRRARLELLEHRCLLATWASPPGNSTPIENARAFLTQEAGSLGLDFPDLRDLTHVFTRDLSFGSVERFQQQVDGIPVYEAEIAVTVNDNGALVHIFNGYQPDLHLVDAIPAIEATAARHTALQALGITGPLNYDSTRLVVFPGKDGARLAYQVGFVPATGEIGDYEVVVDADTGVILQSLNRATNATGTGAVFNPDPLTTSNSTYGAPGYTDAGDADSAQLTAQRQTVTLPDITLTGGTYSLVGPYAQIVDTESPFNGLFTQASSTFDFTRSQAGFEAVNTYYHVDKFMRYLNTTLGLSVAPIAHTGGVKFDPSGLSGADNSHYLGSTNVIAFGEGGVDDAEDADVIIHELGHGIHDWVTGGNLSQVNGLSEGTGDYFAQSYSRSLGLWPTSHPGYHYTFSWDGHNEYWNGRTTNYSALYPGGLVGQVHSDGQIWATANMKIWDVLGAAKTDALMVEGLSMTGGSTNQQQAAQALIQAAIELGYTTAELNSIHAIYTATGYSVTLPTPPTQLRGTVWNDANGNGTRDAGDNGQAGWTVYLDANDNGTLDGQSGSRVSTDVPKSLPDLTTVTSQIVITDLPGIITDVNVTLSLTHSYDGDLNISLIAPTGARVSLAPRVGGSGDHFTNTVFDQQAATPITSGSAPFTGSFRPAGSLSSLNGLIANGTWRLEIADAAGGDTGTLTAWSLQLVTGEASTLTSSTGEYVFNNMTAGSYTVREVVQATWTQTVPVAGSHNVTLATGQVLANLDFANTRAPQISAIPDQTLAEDLGVTVNFTVLDTETPATMLVVSATSSNHLLLPLDRITFGGSGVNRSMTYSPVANQFGSATITITVTDTDGFSTQRIVPVTIYGVNDPPTFVPGSNQAVPLDAGPQTISGWATAISRGPDNESEQSLSFSVQTNSNPDLFASLPTVSADGTLTYTPAAGAVGVATIEIVAQDSGGAENGGADTSVVHTFTITINPPSSFQVLHYAATNTGVVVNLSRDVLESTLNLYDGSAGGLEPADVSLVGATVGIVKGSLIVDPNLRQLTFVKTAGGLAPDTYTLTLRSGADALQDSSAVLLDGDANGVPGGDFVQTFVVAPPAANAVTVDLANFARGPQQAVNLIASSATGMPLSFSNGEGITTATLEVRYNPALLNITAASEAAGLPEGATVNLDTSTPGVALLTFHSPTPLVAGATHFASLQADVPGTALYRHKHVLDLANIVLNGGAIPALDDDGVHVVAYFGDVTGNGAYSAQDASYIARLAVGIDTGLEEFALLDPSIIGDITGNGAFSSTDTSLMLRAAVGITVPEIPSPLPTVSLAQGGPDPKLSIPKNLVAPAGGSLTIPVDIDSIVNLTGNGLASADLVIYYDPTVLEITGATLGRLVQQRSGWIISSHIDRLAGRIDISLAGTRRLEGEFIGELVQLHATVKADAPAGSSAINLAATSRRRSTQLNEGFLTLIPAPTDSANDAIDGRVTITPAGNIANNEPAVRLIGEQLLITGTIGDDRILVSHVDAEHVRVRIGNRLLGTFAAPQGVSINALAGNDFIYVAPTAPASIIAAEFNSDDLIFTGDNSLLVESSSSSDQDEHPATAHQLNSQDLALLQLLANWHTEHTENLSAANPSRTLAVRRR